MRNYFILLLTAILFSGCNTDFYHLYSPLKSDGLDFSKGRWLIGNIETNPRIKEELSNMVFKDFSAHLGNRLAEVRNEKLLIAERIPLNPNKKEIQTLKQGTNYDYFINIKSKNESSDIDNFKWTDHNYYKNDMAFAALAIEVYDLNKGEIIYTQIATGSIDRSTSTTFKPTDKIILGCYKKVRDNLFSKSQLH